MTRLTVLLICHNDAPFVGAAIESVLAQTVRDFELLIIDDASTDGSRAILDRYRDPRIRVLVNATNAGGPASRNRGLAAITTEYVAMLDGNDLCMPSRLQRQVTWLDTHPEAAVVGSQARIIDVEGRTTGLFRRPVTESGIRWAGIFQSPVIHSAVMMRRAVIWDELGGYDAEYRYGEDFDLWRRLARRHAIHNLAETLVAYRDDPQSLSSAPGHPAREGNRVRKARKVFETLEETLPCADVTLEAVEQWLALGDTTVNQTPDEIRSAIDMVERCAAAFASIHGQNGEVLAHQAGMLARALEKAPELPLWRKVWMRDRPAALRALPHLMAVRLLGMRPLAWRRALRRLRARRWKSRHNQ